MNSKILRLFAPLLFLGVLFFSSDKVLAVEPCKVTGTSLADLRVGGVLGECGEDGGCPEGMECTGTDPEGTSMSFPTRECMINPLKCGPVSCGDIGLDCCDGTTCYKGYCDRSKKCKCYESGPCTNSSDCCSGHCYIGQCAGNPSACNTTIRCGSAAGCSEGQICQSVPGGSRCMPDTYDSCGHGWQEEPPGSFIYRGPVITSLEGILNPIARILYFGGLFIGICFIIYSGYSLMVSQGNPQRTQAAQEQLTASILGIMFILLSAAILRVIINSIIGVNISI